MRALCLESPSNLVFSKTIPEPIGSPSEYLIRVHATAITTNELTWPMVTSRDMAIPGHDLCGTILSAPSEGEAQFEPGEEIFALTSFSRNGSAAEIMLALPGELARKPSNLTREEACAVPLSALTAWQALFVHVGLKADHRLLVLGAAGGVGVMAVQLARWKGAKVTGTCSGRNIDFVKSLGADEVIDYTKQEVTGRFDLILDCVGGAAQDESWEHMKERGFLVSVHSPWSDVKKAQYPMVESRYFIVDPNGEQLAKIAELVQAGHLTAIVDMVFPLEKGVEAFDLLGEGHVRGKIVIRVD